jgi:hypothetical protein
MLHLPEAIIQIWAPFAPLFSRRVWLHAQVLLLGARLAPKARTVTAALRAMGLAAEHRVTNYHRVLNRATWSARLGNRILLGLLITLPVPPGRDDRPRGGRHGGTPFRPEDHRQGLLPRCGSFHQEACHPLFRPEVDGDDAVGPSAVGTAGVGVAPSHHAVLVREAARTTTVQDQYGLGAADDAAGAPLAAGAAVGAAPGARDGVVSQS